MKTTHPEKRDQGDSIGPGLIVFAVLFIVASLALAVFIQDNPSSWLAFLSRVCWFFFGCYVFLWLLPMGIIKFVKRRIEERRYRLERDEGLNGPSNQR
jgi:Kef-type K+ transport system membrane component KefB